MALTQLLDTSVLTRLGVPAIRSRVDALFGAGSPCVSRLTALELGFSARSGAEWSQTQQALEVFTLVDVTDEDHRQALAVQQELAARGHRGRKVPDLLIAASAARLRATVIHYDRDFELIAAVTGQSVEWIVPAGSID